MITTTELIKLLQDNELGGISHKPRKISLTVNGRCLPEPQITLSSTGDGILGPEIDFDVDGECLEPEPCSDAISREDAMFMILHYGNEIRHEVMDDIKASMIKLPSVTHARPKGYWIKEFNDEEGEVRFTCSNCGKYQLFESNFCYHCGSDNGKEEE